MNDSHLADRLKEINDQIAERNEEKQKLLKQKFDISSEVDDILQDRMRLTGKLMHSEKKRTDCQTKSRTAKQYFDNLNKKER